MSHPDKRLSGRTKPIAVAALSFSALMVAAALAPEFLGDINPDQALKGPLDVFPFGTDTRGRALVDYATQGARVVALPALAAGVLVGLFGVIGGILRCVGSERVNALLQAFSEIVGALPRMVVILVVALLVPEITGRCCPSR